MRSFKVTYEILSSTISPFQADTIFGSLCWVYRYLYGSDALEEFLEIYKKGEPPLILSDGFPDGMLPRPILKPLSRQEITQIHLKHLPDPPPDVDDEVKWRQVNQFETVRKQASQKSLPLSFLQNCVDSISELVIADYIINDRVSETLIQDVKFEIVYRSTINRMTGMVKTEGGLFPSEEKFYPKGARISIYVKAGDEILLPESKLRSLFEGLAITGYGKDKSSGRGQLRLQEFRAMTPTDLPAASKPNAFMTLSSYVPKASVDPVQGYYSLVTKYGKLGEEFATSTSFIRNIKIHPFKTPVLMFTAGSTFFLPEEGATLKDYYGRLVDGVHPFEKIRQYGYAYPLGLRIEDHDEL